MFSAPIPEQDDARLAALARYCVLDTAAEPAFDRLTRVAAHVMQVPTVLVSLVDRDRQWFKSRVGLAAEQTPRDISFCGHAVALRETLLVPDVQLDPRFADNPLVTGDLGLRFYMGVPLITADGHALGTLCIIDYVARSAPPPEQTEILVQLAEAVVAALELRLLARAEGARTRLAQTLGAIAEQAHQAGSLRQALASILQRIGDYGGAVTGQVHFRADDADDRLVGSDLRYGSAATSPWGPADDAEAPPAVQALRRSALRSREAVWLVDLAWRNSKRLTRLVTDMLDIAKIEAGQMSFEPTLQALPALIERALQEIEGFAAPLGVRTCFDPCPDGSRALVCVDADRYTQVLVNLVSNAVKFSPAGGLVSVGLKAHCGHWRVSVSDQGPGIAPGFRPRLFEKFAQAESGNQRRGAGTGLGLAIVKRIVEASGGQVSFEAGDPQGAVFHVDLPIRAAA